MSKLKTAKRSEIAESDKWDLSTLYKNDAEWEADLKKLPELLNDFLEKKPTLEKIDDFKPEIFLSALKAYEKTSRLASKLGHYASLMQSADASDSKNNKRMQKFMIQATELDAKMAWFLPLLMKLPEAKLLACCEREDFADYKVFIKKRLYMKAHVLSEREEKILSLLDDALYTPAETFSILTNVNFNFGEIETARGKMSLTNSSFSQFMLDENRDIREKAYKQYYRVFDQYKDTIATLYAGNVKANVTYAKIKGFSSARNMALYPDKVDEVVYDNLIDTIHKNFKPLHKFYSIIKRALKLKELRHYDVYVPLVPNVKKHTTYDEAVDIIYEALKPLGTDYVDILCDGLKNAWVDRYENIGKRSGAFSSGGYEGYPYIMLNYKEDVIRDLFTMVHEGGHSMHSYFSVRNNPYTSYNYSIFEAEVASTFNEELLFQYLIKNTNDEKLRTYLLSIRVGDVLATLYRQTMFAEFEKIMHASYESGIPITCDFMREEYGKLLRAYFGDEMHFEETSNLEALRIPHFYNAFYVYKYSTGISAALALAERVLNGGENERKDYYKFLKSGGSRYPIEALKLAGVDMSKPDAVQAACDNFTQLLDELEKGLTKLGVL